MSPCRRRRLRRVGHLPRGVVGRALAQQLRHRGAQVGIAKPAGKQGEQTQGRHEGHDTRLPKGESRGALAILHLGANHRGEAFCSDRAVMAESLDVQKTPVG